MPRPRLVPPERIIPPDTFAEIRVTGHAAEWIRDQRKLHGGQFEPSAIQQLAIKRIYEGESCILHAATGTGKTLCFLLPLIQRMLEEARLNKEHGRKVRGDVRMLILAPGRELLRQTSAYAQALVGPHLAPSVKYVSLEGDVETAATIVVATAKQLAFLLEDPQHKRYWEECLTYLDSVVVDEADRFLDGKNKRISEEMEKANWEVDCAYVLRTIDELTTKAGRRENWQLVAATATLGQRTQRALTYSSGIELSVIRSLERKIEDSDADYEEKLQRGKEVFRPGSSLLSVRHRVRALPTFDLRWIKHSLMQCITDLEAERTLVVLCEKQKQESMRLNCTMIQSALQSDLPSFFEVRSLDSAVRHAARLWSSDRSQERVAERKRPEVIVARDTALRGIHLDQIEFVLVIGLPVSIREYLHITGRTCRHMPGQAEPPPGLVMTICKEQEADCLTSWCDIMDINLVDVPPKRHLIPPLDERMSRTAEEPADAEPDALDADTKPADA